MRLRAALALVTSAVAIVLLAAGASALAGDETDPARNVALPCELVKTSGGVPRAARGIVHLANVCGIVGTDVELQSRKDARGSVHDFAFVGTMGAGMRIYDVTNPAQPVRAGGYVDTGWENDVQLRGNLAVGEFSPVSAASLLLSLPSGPGPTCQSLKAPSPPRRRNAV